MYYSGGFADDARHATISALAGDRVGRDFLATKNVKLARAFGRKICCVHRLATAAPAPKTLRAALAASAVARLDAETEAAVVETTDDPRLRGLIRVALRSAANWSRSAMMESHVLAHGDLHGWNVLLRDADVKIVDYELAHAGGGAIVDLAMYRRVRDRDNVEALLRAYHACRFGRSGEGGDTYDRGLARRSEVRKMLFDLEIGVANIVLEKLATCATLAGGGCARLDIERFVATARHLDPVDGAAAAPPSAAQISAVGAMYAAISDETRRDAVVDLGVYAASRGRSRA
jgi:aminoglycoside phosphotransferase (APT) family kinase protein